MEINKGLAKLNFKKFDLTKNSILTELFGELQDYCSDTDENLTQFKKFRMIVTQVNIFKELTESIDHSNTMMALIRKIETLGLDNSTAKWAVKLVADALNIKNNLTISSPTNQVSVPVKSAVNAVKPNKQTSNAKKSASKNVKTKSNQSKSTYIPQPRSASPSYSAPKSGFAKTATAYKPKSANNKGLFYNVSALISILLGVGGILIQIQNPFSGAYVIAAYSILIVLSIILLSLAASNYEDAAAYAHSAGLLIYIYSLLFVLGMGFIYAGLAIVSVIIMLIGISVMISDDMVEFGPWTATLFGLLLLNLSLIEGGILTGVVPFVTTGVAGAIALFTSMAGFSDYEEGFGILNGIFFIGTLIQFIFLFF